MVYGHLLVRVTARGPDPSVGARVVPDSERGQPKPARSLPLAVAAVLLVVSIGSASVTQVRAQEASRGECEKPGPPSVACGTVLEAGQLTRGYHGLVYGGKISLRPGKPGWATPPVVRAVLCGSPAHEAGLMAGDTIFKVNGEDAREPGVLSPEEPGMTFRLTVRRGGEQLEFVLTAVERTSGDHRDEGAGGG